MEIRDDRTLGPSAIRDEEEAKASQQSVVSGNKITRHSSRRKPTTFQFTHFQKIFTKPHDFS
jgi:hypothetical protein